MDEKTRISITLKTHFDLEKDKNVEKLEELFAETDQKLLEAQKAIQYLDNFVNSFQKIRVLLEDLEEFYFSGEWLEGRSKLEELGLDDDFLSTGEDEIWDVHVAYHSLKLRLLKEVSDSLTKGQI